MKPNYDLINRNVIEEYLSRVQPKPGRRVIWNSYSRGTYIKAKYGPIGSGKYGVKQ